MTAIQLREVLAAAVGWKVTRVALHEQAALAVVPRLRDFGLGAAISEDRYLNTPDIGKGGWSNGQCRIALAGTDGDLYIYVAQAESALVAAVESEADGDPDRYGCALGIPSCCRVAYQEYLVTARAAQNDAVPMTAFGTTAAAPHPGWNNIASQYFGYSLLSFAPCSLRCRAAQQIARATHALIDAVDPTLARHFYDAHHSSIVYSEWDGIHRLLGTCWTRTDTLSYDGIVSTAQSPLADALQVGDRLRVTAAKCFELFRGSDMLGSWNAASGSEIALFLCEG